MPVSQDFPSMKLPMEVRRELVAALVQRVMSGGQIPSANQVAALVTLDDQDLVVQLQGYESDGDDAIAKVLARLGLSERPCDLELYCEHAGLGEAPLRVALTTSVAQLARFELEHFAVRGVQDFQSLRLHMPGPCGAGFAHAAQATHARVLFPSAILTSSLDGEPVVQFEITVARDSQFDETWRSQQVSLPVLRAALASCVGDTDALVWSAGGETVRTVLMHWLRGDGLPVLDCAAAVMGEPERQRG